MMWKRERKINGERYMIRTNMTWKRERTRKKGIMRTKITWNRERNTYTKVNSEVSSNMRQKLTVTTSP